MRRTLRVDDRGMRIGATGGLVAALVGAVVFAGLFWLSPFVGVVLLVLAVAAIRSTVEVVDAYEQKALTVLGEFRGLLEPGINFVPPFVADVESFDMRTRMIDVPRQEAITQDNSPVTTNAVVYIRVMDPERAFLEVEDYERAVANLAQTTLRSVIGDMDLDGTLHNRRRINREIHRELSEPTDEWGIRIEAVEVENIIPSQDVVSSMEQQTAAERRRRAMILEAQGERRSAIERAQGDRQSNIVRAQGEKQAQILEAQGDSISTVLRARAADSMGERAILEKGFETVEAIGEGDAETYVVPQELTSAVGKYGRNLDGVPEDSGGLEGKEFDEDDRRILGLDDIEETLGEVSAVDVADDGAVASSHDEVADTHDEVADTHDEIDVDEPGPDAHGSDPGAARGIADTSDVEAALEETAREVDDALGEVSPDVDAPDAGDADLDDPAVPDADVEDPDIDLEDPDFEEPDVDPDAPPGEETEWTSAAETMEDRDDG